MNHMKKLIKPLQLVQNLKETEILNKAKTFYP